MLAGVLFALLAAVMWTGNAVALTLATRRRLAILPFYALATGLATLWSLGLVQRPALIRTLAPADLRALVLVTLACGVVNVGAMLCQLKGFKLGHKGITWTVLHMAMAISFLAGVVIWHEAVRWTQYVGLAAVLGTLALVMPQGQAAAKAAGGPGPNRWLTVALAGLVLSGLAQVLYIVPSRWGCALSAAFRTALLLAVCASLAGGLAWLTGQRVCRAMLAPALLLSVCSVLGLLFTAVSGDLLAARALAGLVYPISTGTSVVLFALGSRIVLREPFRARTWAGLALGVIGLAVLSLRP